MTQVNMYEAKTHFAELIRRVLLGEEVVIARAGRPLVKLVPLNREDGQRAPGSAKGQIAMADDFDAPLPPDLLEGFHA